MPNEKEPPANSDQSEVERVMILSQRLGNVTVVRKGERDIITNGNTGRFILSVYHWLESF